MRQIVLDTETTGLDPKQGHRLVEIGCLEVVNYMPTGRVFHAYLNPDRSMPIEAFNVHGLSEEFLKDKPKFEEIAEEFLGFIEDYPLVIHNAQFDMKFINHELITIGKVELDINRAIDTLHIARQKFPGAQASLDALCRRFKIDNSARTNHGALLDAELLAEVYLELCGGRQPNLTFSNEGAKPLTGDRTLFNKVSLPPRSHHPSVEELEQHKLFLKKLMKPMWSHYQQN
ncbi:MAG: DNA polymerase III subunit epsilon [Alphaproteobacteria bacterium]|nr:DNA polymerase III subunit epsilon [Alphaproteobacteria bacterium]